MTKNLCGYLLAASPRMVDARFERTVILLVQHDQRGAVGVVLNRPADAATRARWQGVVEQVVGQGAEVGIGGPLSGPVFAFGVRAPAGLGSEQPPAKIARFRIRSASDSDEPTCRVFLGCSRWEAGQLEQELSHGEWLLMRATPEHVFGDVDELWRAVVQQVGTSVLRDLGIEEFPTSPLLN